MPLLYHKTVYYVLALLVYYVTTLYIMNRPPTTEMPHCFGGRSKPLPYRGDVKSHQNTCNERNARSFQRALCTMTVGATLGRPPTNKMRHCFDGGSKPPPYRGDVKSHRFRPCLGWRFDPPRLDRGGQSDGATPSSDSGRNP